MQVTVGGTTLWAALANDRTEEACKAWYLPLTCRCHPHHFRLCRKWLIPHLLRQSLKQRRCPLHEHMRLVRLQKGYSQSQSAKCTRATVSARMPSA